MMKITVSNLNNLSIQNNDNTKTVFTILQENYVDWMHACGAKGKCTTCKFVIKENSAVLSEKTEAEINYQKTGRLNQNERLACQVRLLEGEIEIEVPNSSKLPHMQYSY
jgi:2Fe-2S ferredoxin